MAEREGFEPSVRSPPRSLSKGVLSTTQPSLHIEGFPVGRLIHWFCGARQSLDRIFFIYFMLPCSSASEHLRFGVFVLK